MKGYKLLWFHPHFVATHKYPSGHEKHGVPFFSVVLTKFIYNEKGELNHYFPVRRHISIIKRLFRGGVAGGLCRCGVGVVLIWNKYSESIFLASRRLTFHLKKILVHVYFWHVGVSQQSTMHFIKSWKTSAVSTTVWMVERQLCKLHGTSDAFV